MNNFTKEELYEISNSLGWMIDIVGDAHFALELRDKVERMINNYCEHDFQLDWFDGPGGTYKCTKCNEISNDPT